MPRTTRNSGRKKFEYKKRTKEQVQKRAEQQSGDFKSIFKDGVKVWKPKKGDNAIRILPATWEEPEHYALDVHIHYGVGADEERVLALHEMLGEEDPIRELRMEFEGNGEKELAKACRPGRACAMWIVDMDNEEEGAQIFLAPQTVDAGIAQVSIDKRSGEMFDIDDPEDGYEVYFTKQGEGMNTKYVGFQLARNPSEVCEEALEHAIDNPIPDILAYLEYEEIEKMITGWTPKPRGAKKDDKKGGGKKGSHRGRGGRDEEPEDDGKQDRDEGDYKYDDVLKADWDELEDIVEIEELDIDLDEYEDDETEQAAKDILEALGIEPPKKTRGGRRGSKGDAKDKVAGMRRNRR